MLKDACDAAEKAKDDLMEKSKVSEVFVTFTLLQLLSFICFMHFETPYVYMNEDHEYIFSALDCFICPQNVVQELEGYLFTEKQNNRENTFEIEQLRKEIIHHE